jgi:hypothetical protein
MRRYRRYRGGHSDPWRVWFTEDGRTFDAIAHTLTPLQIPAPESFSAREADADAGEPSTIRQQPILALPVRRGIDRRNVS